MRKKILSTVPVSITAAAGDAPSQKRFEMKAYTGEPMNISGFDLPIVVDLSTVDVTQQRIPILYDHCPDVDFVVGQSDKITNDGSTITASGLVNGVGKFADQVRELAAGGYVWQASIGAEPSTIEEIKTGESVTVNGRGYVGPCYVARGCVLREISFVVLGGDRKTSALVARNKPKKPIKGKAMDFDSWLLSMGFEDKASLSPVQLANLEQMYNAQGLGETSSESEVETPTNAESETPPVAEETPPANAAAKAVSVKAELEKMRAEAAAESLRISDIKRISAAYNGIEITVGQKKTPLEAHAIREGWTKERTELEAMRTERAQHNPGIIVRGNESNETTVQGMTAALMLRAGRKLDDPRINKIQRLPDWLRASINDPNKNKIFDLAHRFSDMSLVDMARECLRIEGRVDSLRGSKQEMIRAAMSGSNFTNIFSTNVNLVLLSTYMEAADSTVGWTTETEVADFKTNERTRVQVGEGLKRRARGQEADHTSFTDSTESYAIAHYARQFVVDYVDIVNDSTGAMSDTPQKFGLAAARLRPDLVYAQILANGNLGATSRALFNSTDGNTAAGALSSANLEAAIASMSAQTENSVSLNVMATHLIVPSALQFTARQLLTSTDLIRSGSTDTVSGSRNVIPDLGLQMAFDSRLQNGVTDPATGTAYSGSSTQWFLASTYMNTIEVAYLRGTGRSPEVRTKVYDGDGKFGIAFDVSHSIGAKALDWRGLWRRTG